MDSRRLKIAKIKGKPLISRRNWILVTFLRVYNRVSDGRGQRSADWLTTRARLFQVQKSALLVCANAHRQIWLNGNHRAKNHNNNNNNGVCRLPVLYSTLALLLQQFFGLACSVPSPDISWG